MNIIVVQHLFEDLSCLIAQLPKQAWKLAPSLELLLPKSVVSLNGLLVVDAPSEPGRRRRRRRRRFDVESPFRHRRRRRRRLNRYPEKIIL